MRRTSSISHAAALVVALAAVATGAPSVRAADAPATNDAASQVKTVLDEISAAQTAKDEGALSTAIKKVGPIYKATQDGALRGSMMTALGGVVKQSKMTTARGDALKAIIETEDGKGAWRVLAGLYPADDLDDPTRWNIEYLNALHDLAPDGAIDKLLETFKKAKKEEVAAAGVRALGGYHKSKQRERILEEIAKSGKNMVPSRSANKNPSQEALARWNAVGEAVGHALDELTGDKVSNPIEWFKKIDEAKKNYKGLFRD